MILATDHLVAEMVHEMREICPGASQSLSNTLDELESSELATVGARAAIELGVGFALFAPCARTAYKLVAFVRPEHRRKGHGRRLVREAIGSSPPGSHVDDVWAGTDTAYRFWKNVGVIP